MSLPLVFHRLLLEMTLIFTIQVENYEFASVVEITKLNKTPKHLRAFLLSSTPSKKGTFLDILTHFNGFY